jgi:alpha-L-fucosidase 2
LINNHSSFLLIQGLHTEALFFLLKTWQFNSRTCFPSPAKYCEDAKMKNKLIIAILMCLFFNLEIEADVRPEHNLVFSDLAESWDEAMPLGNGMLGNLVWQKNGKLRFSLDRADLWDLRPMENIDFEKWSFNEVFEHWKADEYKKVQEAFDVPYNKLAAPSKIPAGALEFDMSKLGKVREVVLDVEKAVCRVEWENGAMLTTFVHAEKPVGWYRFDNVPVKVAVEMIPPAYNTKGDRAHVDQSMSDLDQLGYEQGAIQKKANALVYDQKGWGDFSYQISTEWEKINNSVIGCWSISSANDGWEVKPEANEVVAQEIKIGFDASFKEHKNWWSDYWRRSNVDIPDPLLQKQYVLEMYKFGSAARSDAPPIALQSVWTADNGKLPPWKGDFHHDLNTQLSYWPAYAGNLLHLEEGFLNWLWQYRATFKKYTRDYFGVEGMNVPGVTTLEGEPMGGWIQYSMGQTVSAWLAHHFYLHWRYSMDRDFLKDRAYPWIKDVAVYLDNIAEKSEGERKLRMSSSPEIFNNSREAWFAETTNFDLSLIHWTYEKAAELAAELGLSDEASEWTQVLSEWPELSVDPQSGFNFAPGFQYEESHRHLSHLMAFHPLSMVDVSNGDADKTIIDNTLRNLEKHGSDYWTGYSFSWMGGLYARAFEGENAARVLSTFAECFCLKNSFHVNGDQCKAGHSNFTYRPFTLEGNFAFASAIQEMLLQSHTGVVRVFPAIPTSWDDVKFDNLRAQGAFLVSATRKNGSVISVKIKSEKGGDMVLINPFEDDEFISVNKVERSDGLVIISLDENETVVLQSTK